MKAKIVKVLSVLLLSSTAFSQTKDTPFYKLPNEKSEPVGIILKVAEGISPNEIKNLKKFAVSSYLDFKMQSVVFKTIFFQKSNPKKNYDFKKICSLFAKRKGVASCEIDMTSLPQNNQQIEARDCTECPLKSSNWISEISEIARKIIKKTCTPFENAPDVKWFGGKLTDYWAQEYVGADLLRDIVKTTNPVLPENFLAIFDEDEDDHQVAVRELISSTNAHGVLPFSSVKNIFYNQVSTQSSYYEAAEKMIKNNRIPRFVNISMANIPYTPIEKLGQEHGSIVIISAGNLPTLIAPTKRQLTENDLSIIVASYAPTGQPSAFSSYDPLVHISAPSHNQILSQGRGGRRAFGGTSGAAPLVTGTLAAFELISGHRLTTREAITLLDRTAIPVLESKNKYGKGLLNAYKIGLVAQRLKDECGKASPAKSCFENKLSDPNTYNFATNSSHIASAKSVFPVCFGEETKEPIYTSCFKKKEIIRALRSEALKVTGESNIWKALSCIYNQEGKKLNSIFYASIVFATNSTDRSFHLALVDALKGEDSSVRDAAVQALMSIKPTDPEILSALYVALKDSSSHVRVAAAGALGSIKPTDPEVLSTLVGALNDPVLFARVKAAEALGRIKATDPKAHTALVGALNDPVWFVREMAVQALSDIKPTDPKVHLALAEAIKDRHHRVRERAARAFIYIKFTDPKVKMTLTEALNDPDSRVRQSATMALGSFYLSN